MEILKVVLVLCLSFTAYAKDLNPGTIKNLKTIHLKQDESKNKKLLYFWASWCPDCRDKLRSELRDLKKNRADIEVLTVNLDRREKKGKHFIDEEKLPFAVVRDEDKALRKQLAIFSVPAWAVIEKKEDRWVVLDSSAGSDMEHIKKTLGDKR